MGAGLAAARPNQESSKATAAEDRGVARTKKLEGNSVLGPVAILVACNLAISVAREIVARAKSVRRDDEWSTEMLPELLCSISDNLPLIDCMSFRRVCKSWRSAPFGRSELANFSHERPWLLFYGLDDKDDTCYFYSASRRNCCTLKLPGLRGATCVDSMYGWLLARRGRRFFFYNPLSMEKIELAAEYPHGDAAEQVCAFEFFPPPSPCCTVVVVSRRREKKSTVEISSCRVGDKEWRTEMINIGELEFGKLRFARTILKDYGIIYVYFDGSRLTYKVTKKSWSHDQLPPYLEGVFFNGFRAIHQNDWLRRFGKRGIVVSVCPLHMTLPCRGSGVITMTGVVAAGESKSKEGELKPKLKDVKAVWIQPPRYKLPYATVFFGMREQFNFISIACTALVFVLSIRDHFFL